MDWEDDLPDLPTGAYSDENKHEVDNEWLEGAETEEQVAAMANWFRARFWDPAHETPYMTSEGGYIWVHGGPYDATEQLYGRFSGVASEEAIDETIELVQSTGIYDWAPTPLTYYDEEQDVFVDERNEPTKRLQARLDELLGVLGLEGQEEAKGTVRKLAFAGAIATLETFLWETMVYWVEHDASTVPNIITKVPVFKDRPIKLGQIFSAVENSKAEVRAYLQNLVWHQFEKVAPLMKHGLGIELPSFRPFHDALQKRHDVVHRSGHDIDGNPIAISEVEIRDLADEVMRFANEVDSRIAIAKLADDL